MNKSRFTSKQQAEARLLVVSIVGHMRVMEDSSPLWLKKLSGCNLELDLYIPDLNFAIEVQGVQHGQYVEYFHRSPLGFKQAQQRDIKKRVACNKYDVDLFEVWDSSDLLILRRVLTARYQSWIKTQDCLPVSNARGGTRRGRRSNKRYIITDNGGNEFRVSKSQFSESVQYCKCNQVASHRAIVRSDYQVVVTYETPDGHTHVRFDRISEKGTEPTTPKEESSGQDDSFIGVELRDPRFRFRRHLQSNSQFIRSIPRDWQGKPKDE